jgi:putative Mg2+ transporter-C (MgtC) family protein
METLNTQYFFEIDDSAHVGRVLFRLVIALVLGAMLGVERERLGKAAGVRTHMLVALGSALLVLGPVEAGMKLDHLSRVIQGIAAGIGFLGAGAILKMPEERRISGLTTAATVWVTAAVGIAIGMGLVWPSVLAVVLATGSLYLVRRLETRLESDKKTPRAE